MLKTYSGRPASQDARELAAFTDFLRENGVRRYLEIGARHGDTFHYVMSVLGSGARGLAVDLPGGAWGTSKSKRALEMAVVDLNARGIRAHCLFGDSHDPEMIGAVSERGPFDAVLIDADHRYDAVVQDFRDYAPLGRLIAFHDIAGDGETTRDGLMSVEVPRFWREVREKFAYREFISPGSTMGIGVLVMPADRS